MSRSTSFGTPRERISVVRVDNQNRILKEVSGEDVTELLKEEIEAFIDKNPDVDAIVLKSKSPSCGYRTTPILNLEKEQIGLGNGIATELFLKQYQNILISDEKKFIDS
ncbi:MAG: DUF523 domain-containing protein [Sulfurimonas sp.]|nr:DUF523 domain-containing protein [Sulfurimonas sp.]